MKYSIFISSDVKVKSRRTAENVVVRDIEKKEIPL